MRSDPEDEGQLQPVGADLAGRRVTAVGLARRRDRQPQRRQVVNGEGVLKDPVLARMWFNIAGANGHDAPPAELQLGYLQR